MTVQFDGNYTSAKFDGNYTSAKFDGNYTSATFIRWCHISAKFDETI